LGMNSSGFDYDALLEYMALGVTYLANGTRVLAPVEQLGWSNPMGGMLSSPRDMSKFISFLFRNGDENDDSQIVDFDTVREMMSPIILTDDGISGFGTPWEFEYNSASRIWVRGKAGELLGYRSQMAVIPEIKLGLFIVATDGVADDDTRSIFTIPVMNIILPIFLDVLQAAQTPLPIPSTPDKYTGLYMLTDTMYNTIGYQVYSLGNAMFGSYVVGDTPFSNSTLEYITGGGDTFRIGLIDNTDICRWRDDGLDDEFIYFNFSSGRGGSTTLIVMGQLFTFVSKNCPNC